MNCELAQNDWQIGKMDALRTAGLVGGTFDLYDATASEVFLS